MRARALLGSLDGVDGHVYAEDGFHEVHVFLDRRTATALTTLFHAVGAWLKAHKGMVAAFYLSNVEQYLQQDGIWMDFCKNALALPIDESSQFIRSFRPNGGGFGGGGASLNQGIWPIHDDLKNCQ